MSRAAQVAGAAVLALALAAITLTTIQARAGAAERVEMVQQGRQRMQMLDEFSVAGTMQTGEPAPQGIPLSFQLPVPLPAPSPPAPTVITVGPRPKKAPVCKRCERQMRKIKVRRLAPMGRGGVWGGLWRFSAWRMRCSFWPRSRHSLLRVMGFHVLTHSAVMDYTGQLLAYGTGWGAEAGIYAHDGQSQHIGAGGQGAGSQRCS